ncbi:MAG: glycoside hydrolase family 3 C-terminal domain-containing protein [Bacteroidales bacterium]|nr:glycoside hydrolase family 3 C-terminal domain-containing protein [Bacteroidales bacterium]
MKLKMLFFGAMLAVMASCTAQTPQQLLTAHDAEIDAIIAQMTLEEKVEMMHSKTIMSSEGVPRLGIQDIKYADGPFGCREEVGDGFRAKGWQLDSATYFPTGSALAATWSGDLAYEYGRGMGSEWRTRGKDVILGPAMNIQRIPTGGRTYEYFSEDPFLNAILATGYTKGAQSEGTAVCLKHYAVNNQETNRGSVNAVVDERTLREIYLKAFEMAVKEGGAMSVMTAYNKVNGFYCSENEHLNNEILRDEWGFNGFTVSDWGGTHSTMGAALHGLNVQMTGSNYLGPALIDSVNAGKVPMEVIDRKVKELLRVRFAIEAIPEDKANIEMTSKEFGQQIAYQVAKKSIVLLKNDGGLLPIDKSKVKKIAVIGLNATASTAAGGMGAGVKTLYEITPLQGILNEVGSDVEVTYTPGYKNYMGMFGRWMQNSGNGGNIAAEINEPADPAMLADAVLAASAADLVIFFAGTNKNIESEGSDRTNIDLPVGQNEIVKAIAEANPNLVTVVISGAPTDLRQVVEVSPALVQGWWNGLEGGHALADVLFGKIAPSGKLPFTFPLKLEDSPAYALDLFPQKNEVQGDLFGNQYRQDIGGQRAFRAPAAPDALYSEGLLVGYRWFDTKKMDVLYPFGYGLSYVDFEYSGVKADKASYKENGKVKVTVNVANNGGMEADEVVQLYVHRNDAKVEWPEKELKAFQRVTVQPGETKSVVLEFPVSELRYWDVESNGWKLEHGSVDILVGSSSRDIRGKATINI